MIYRIFQKSPFIGGFWFFVLKYRQKLLIKNLKCIQKRLYVNRTVSYYRDYRNFINYGKRRGWQHQRKGSRRGAAVGHE